MSYKKMMGEALEPLRQLWAGALREERRRHLPSALSLCALTTLATAHIGASLLWVGIVFALTALASATLSWWLLAPAWQRITGSTRAADLAEELEPALGSAAQSAVGNARRCARPLMARRFSESARWPDGQEKT